MSEKQTAVTAHGEVEYEVVKCDSCGNMVLPENTAEFTIGDREGVACEHCVDEGPASFPGSTYNKLLYPYSRTNETYTLWWHVLILPLMVILTPLLIGDDVSDYAQGHGMAIMSVLIWACALGAVLAWWFV